MSNTEVEPPPINLFRGPWEQRLELVRQLMLEMSQQSDPQAMVERYGARVRKMTPNDGIIAVSRRGVTAPHYKITRSHKWGFEFNPWQNAARLPILSGGLLGRLLDEGIPQYLPVLQFDAEDPAIEHLEGMNSLFAMPTYDAGKVLNMMVVMQKAVDGFDRELLPDQLLTNSLFSRVTHNLVLTQEVKRAYDVVDRELQTVGDIQRSLLPDKMPEIPGLTLATHYLTSRRAGGDYYDFFPLADGRWGIFIADVSGHGTPAAVLMAVTHSIAHALPGEPDPPSMLLTHVNQQLARRYTNGNGTFVTAFYGIFDPRTRVMRYASAGHPQPRIKRCDGTVGSCMDQSLGLPLGIDPDEMYENAQCQLARGDTIVLFTDGITEARNAAGDLFGSDGLDQSICSCTSDAEMVVRNILLAVEDFTDAAAPTDDQTLIVARVEC